MRSGLWLLCLVPACRMPAASRLGALAVRLGGARLPRLAAALHAVLPHAAWLAPADFRRKAGSDVVKEVAGLLKGYQEEVDRLTQRWVGGLRGNGPPHSAVGGWAEGYWTDSRSGGPLKIEAA